MCNIKISFKTLLFNIVPQSAGDHSYKQVKELSAIEQMISALPDVKVETVNLETDEFMVLACDGIWNSMTSQQVVDFVRTKLEQKTERLSQICEEVTNSSFNEI